MKDKLIELLREAPFAGRVLDYWWYKEQIAEVADFLIAHGVTVQADVPDNNVGNKKHLTIAERADLERIRISIERKCLDMAQPGMWERYTKNMECGEIREFAQYYRDMELVYKLITGFAPPWPPKECE